MAAERQRSYHSPQRDEQSAATRQAILAAAERLFGDRGFAAVGMPAIAAEAGIAVATAYLYFPGKAAVVSAMAEAVVAGQDLSVEQVESTEDPRAALRIGAGIMRRLNERSWVVADILRTAHATDEELGRAWAQWQARHLHAMERASHALARRGALRPGLSERDATDILYAITSTEVYRLLAGDRGWSAAAYERWLFTFACRELLGD